MEKDWKVYSIYCKRSNVYRGCVITISFNWFKKYQFRSKLTSEAIEKSLVPLIAIFLDFVTCLWEQDRHTTSTQSRLCNYLSLMMPTLHLYACVARNGLKFCVLHETWNVAKLSITRFIASIHFCGCPMYTEDFSCVMNYVL